MRPTIVRAWTQPSNLAGIALFGFKFVKVCMFPLERSAARFTDTFEGMTPFRCVAPSIAVTHGNDRDSLDDSHWNMGGHNRTLYRRLNLIHELLIMRVEFQHSFLLTLSDIAQYRPTSTCSSS